MEKALTTAGPRNQGPRLFLVANCNPIIIQLLLTKGQILCDVGDIPLFLALLWVWLSRSLPWFSGLSINGGVECSRCAVKGRAYSLLSTSPNCHPNVIEHEAL